MLQIDWEKELLGLDLTLPSPKPVRSVDPRVLLAEARKCTDEIHDLIQNSDGYSQAVMGTGWAERIPLVYIYSLLALGMAFERSRKL